MTVSVGAGVRCDPAGCRGTAIEADRGSGGAFLSGLDGACCRCTGTVYGESQRSLALPAASCPDPLSQFQAKTSCH